MSKAKKQSKGNIILEIDKSLDKKYADMLEEIQYMQADIDRAERKAKKKAFKNMKKGNTFYDASKPINVRKEVIKNMENRNFFERVTGIIEELKPICIIIARLVMSLIVSILSIDAVKDRISPKTLNAMRNVYDLAKSVA